MHLGNLESMHMKIIDRTIANAIIPTIVGMAGFKFSISTPFLLLVLVVWPFAIFFSSNGNELSVPKSNSYLDNLFFSSTS